jgi:hypothetical protein
LQPINKFGLNGKETLDENNIFYNRTNAESLDNRNNGLLKKDSQEFD